MSFNLVINERLLAWLALTVACFLAMAPQWQRDAEREARELSAWVTSIIFGMLGSQILLWIPWTSGWGMDWLAAAQRLFQGEWWQQIVGGIALVTLWYELIVVPYTLIIRLPWLDELATRIRGLLFFVLFLLVLQVGLPIVLAWGALADPFTHGLGALGRDTLEVWALIFAAVFITNIWFNMRLNRWLSQDRKFTRLVYWLIVDLPMWFVIVGSWNGWQNNWLTFALTFVVLLMDVILMPAILKPLFPIVAREEWRTFLTAPNQRAQAAALDTEIARLKKEALIKDAVRHLAQHQQWVAEANMLRQRGDLKRAAPLVQKVITALEPISAALNAAQRACFGNAFLVRGKIYLAQGQWSYATADAERARQHVALDEELLGGVAEFALARNDRGDQAVEYCLQYLLLRRGQANEGRTQAVRHFIRTFCELGEEVKPAQARAAQTFAERVLNADSGLAWAHRALGHSLVAQKKWSAALAPLENARALDRQDSATHYLLGVTYRQLNRALDARNAYQESLRLNPRQPQAAHALAHIMLEPYTQTLAPTPPIRNDDTTMALRWLAHATSLDARVAAYHFDLARAYALLGDWAKARAAVERALQIDPNAPGAHHLLAELQRLNGEHPAAIPHYRLALKAFPDQPTIPWRLGQCLVQVRQFTEAISLLAPLTATNAEALLDLGRARLGLREYADAVRDLKIFAATHSQNALGYYYLGCAQAWLGVTQNPAALEEAARAFEHAASFDSAMWRTHTQLGHVRLRQARYNDAIAEYQRAIQTHAEAGLEAGLGLARAYLAQEWLPQAREMMAQLERYYAADRHVQILLALVAELQGDVETAKRAYKQADASGALGVLLFREGKTNEALQLLNQARAQGDDSDRVLYYGGFGKSALGDYLGALADWELLAKRHPDDARLALNVTRVWYLHGYACYQRQEYEQAAAAWEHFYQMYESDADTRQMLAQVYLLAAHQGLGKPSADAALTRARQLGADARECAYWAAMNQLVAGDLAHGANALSQVSEQTDTPHCHYNLGVALLYKGEHQVAIEHLVRAQQASNGALREQSAWALVAGYAGNNDWSHAVALIDALV